METLRSKRLVSGIKDGDMEFLKEFCLLNKGRIQAFIYKYVRDEEMVSPILNEVFINTWLYADEFDDTKCSIESWLFSITSFTIIDILKKTEHTAQLSRVLKKLPREFIEGFPPL